MDEDATIRLTRDRQSGGSAERGTPSGPFMRWLGGLAAGLLVACLAAGAVWWVRRGPPRPSLELATEAQIRADQPTRLVAFRFAPDPKVVVLDFPGLRQQGLMFNRIAAFAEKIDQPHDRLLTDAQLARAIAKHGDTVETYYYGHDYAAATLRRFFALADRDHVALDPQEQWLRGFAGAQGMLADGADQAVITLPRQGADPLVDASFRRTILHHELSHGAYFTDPAYAAYARHFWTDVMQEQDRAAFRRFLLAQDYDPALTDLTTNEMQAYLMHTPDPRAFSAEALGMKPDRLALLQARFLLDMPPGWLRDATRLPAPAPVAPVAARKPLAATSPRRQRSAVSTATAATASRSPRRVAASRAARRALT